MTIDGQLSDWDQIPAAFMHKDRTALRICNDSTSLYVELVTDSMEWMRSISRSGRTVYLNTNGSRAKEFFVRYRGGPTREELVKLRGPRGDSIRGRWFRPQPMVLPMPTDLPEMTCFVRDWIIEREYRPTVARGRRPPFRGTANGLAGSFESRSPKASFSTTVWVPSPGQTIGLGVPWGGTEGLGPLSERPAGGPDDIGMGGPGISASGASPCDPSAIRAFARGPPGHSA
jgi:hypothetical protein